MFMRAVNAEQPLSIVQGLLNDYAKIFVFVNY